MGPNTIPILLILGGGLVIYSAWHNTNPLTLIKGALTTGVVPGTLSPPATKARTTAPKNAPHAV